MILLIVGIITGYLAFRIGKWRHSCAFWEVKAPHNLPLVWHKQTIRIGTWLLVVILSLTFASAISVLISREINSFLGKFSWGVLLAARWFFSAIAATRQATQELQRMEERANNP